MTTKSAVTAKSIGNDLIISRVFNAPCELVFKVWTSKKHVEQWWGPHFIKKNKIEIDLRKGGAYRYVMCGPDGTEYPMKGVFTEIVNNKRITYTCNLDEHPDAWHQMVRNNLTNKEASIDSVVTVTFEDHEGKTRLTITSQFRSKEVMEAFTKMQMVAGWTESMEKFENELNKIINN